MTPSLPPLPPRPERGRGLPRLESQSRPAEGLRGLSQPPPARQTSLPPLAGPAPARSAPRPRRSSGNGRLGLAALMVVGLIGAGGIGALVATVVNDDPAAIEASAQTSPTAGAGSADEQIGLSNAVRTAAPSVVQVISGGSSGSGVIVEPRGLIVTNQHVVGAASRVTVVTADNRRIPAAVETSDAQQDLAILRPNGVAGPGAQVAAEPDGGLQIGDQVFAIGSPFDLPGTVTAGIVSAVGRVNERNGIPMIQTDAPINPGNSGGGLFDLRGRLVGIPTAIAAPIRGNVGIGFAVPSSRVRTLVESVD